MTVTVFRVEARLISPAVGSSCQPAGFKWLVFNHWLLANDNWLVTSCCQPDIVLVTWLAWVAWLPTVITGCVVGFQLSAISWKKLRLSPPAPPPDNQFKMEAETAAYYMR